MSEGTIKISGLKVRTRIGVPEEERADWQELRIDIEMSPKLSFEAMGDDIGSTIDYHAVALEIEGIAEERPRRLIETLAAELGQHLLENHAAERARVQIRKFILPQTDWVGVEWAGGHPR